MHVCVCMCVYVMAVLVEVGEDGRGTGGAVVSISAWHAVGPRFDPGVKHRCAQVLFGWGLEFCLLFLCAYFLGSLCLTVLSM